MENEIVNRVAQSTLLTIDLEALYIPGERVLYDMAENLYEGIILKEKEFRHFLQTHDWVAYQGKHVAIICSADAIVPRWAYMLLAVKLQPHAATVVFGDLAFLESHLFSRALDKIDLKIYEDKKVVIKGCSKLDVPLSAYVAISAMLRPLANSIMYGEPCSTVPIYKISKK
ncbi:MAG: DUF2480 family protein [Cyclobacteriaceae bacterium]|nr:DUF2480 family protein [Cyclobacteriaceae bacterium]